MVLMTKCFKVSSVFSVVSMVSTVVLSRYRQTRTTNASRFGCLLKFRGKGGWEKEVSRVRGVTGMPEVPEIPVCVCPPRRQM